MSDGILSGLDNLDTVFLGDSRDDDFQGGNFVRLSDVEAVVAEALTNPTDEQVKQVARAMGRARERNPRWRRLSGWERDLADARAVLAAAAGGDQ